MKITKTFAFRIIITLFSVLGFACTSNQEGNNKKINLDPEDSIAIPKKVIKIFYNVPTPTEMVDLIRHDQSAFYLELLNPVENAQKYTSSGAIAKNIGVYGVDLSYVKIFGHQQNAMSYLSTLKDMFKKIGIPQDQAMSVFGKIEESVANSDSLLKNINESYQNVNKYLKDNERESTAACIFLGGWIEAMYIAAEIYSKDTSRIDIQDRLLIQKYSLNALIDLIGKNSKDVQLSVYYERLLVLKKSFDKVKIDYINSQALNDTTSRTITITGDRLQIKNREQYSFIVSIIRDMRKMIVSSY